MIKKIKKTIKLAWFIKGNDRALFRENLLSTENSAAICTARLWTEWPTLYMPATSPYSPRTIRYHQTEQYGWYSTQQYNTTCTRIQYSVAQDLLLAQHSTVTVQDSLQVVIVEGVVN